MDELYQVIEAKIAASGYPGKIDGEEFYNDICEQADTQENGTYMFLIKKDEHLSYEGCADVMDEDIDLHYVDIVIGDHKFHVDFDA